MIIDTAAKLLADLYRSALEGEQVLSIHLFGIKYAAEIDGMPVHDLAALAGIPKSYGTEIRKGVKLAKYVVLK